MQYPTGHMHKHNPLFCSHTCNVPSDCRLIRDYCVCMYNLHTVNFSLIQLTHVSKLSPFKSKLQSITLSPTNSPAMTTPSSCIRTAWESYHSLKIEDNQQLLEPANITRLTLFAPTFLVYNIIYMLISILKL